MEFRLADVVQRHFGPAPRRAAVLSELHSRAVAADELSVQSHQSGYGNPQAGRARHRGVRIQQSGRTADRLRISQEQFRRNPFLVIQYQQRFFSLNLYIFPIRIRFSVTVRRAVQIIDDISKTFNRVEELEAVT